ncbi:MAG: twin-arginine translocation signal domain-containing protein [Acidobacteria bacterium]|nr:MAG: twin-arginine translocation signal domain-containing protein [Acidobacteriota bacterium]
MRHQDSALSGIPPKSLEAQVAHPSRRTFLKNVAAASVAAAGVRAGMSQAAEPVSAQSENGRLQKSEKKVVAIQIPAVSFSDEGVDKVLDTVQERGGVNTLLIAVFSYGRGIEGRQIPGHPLPDHGVQKYDTDTFHGGDFAEVHPEYYAGTIFKNFRAPELGNFDVLGEVVPKAKKRGMKSICWFEDVYNPRLLDNFEKAAEVDVYGRKTDQSCLNNPHLRNFLSSMVEDWTKSYDVDGIMWCCERQGALNNAIDADHGQPGLTCFCEHCTRKGEEQGINVERARQGLMQLDRWVRMARTQPRPSDGYFVTFWRLLLDYPEILAWEKLWTDSQREVYGHIYGTAKSINSNLDAGFHVMHLNSFNPFYRAEQDYRKLSQHADILKVCMYNNCAGPRMANYIDGVHSTIWHDAPAQSVLELYYNILGYQGEAPLDKLRVAGFSSDYVYRETKRALADIKSARVPTSAPNTDLAGPANEEDFSDLSRETRIYPGIDIDIPTRKGQKKTQPSDVRNAVKAAFNAGAPGVILSRKYSEMRLANLSGAGAALKDLGIRT